MDLTALRSIVGGTPLPDVASCRAELEHLRTARGVLDAREVEVLGRLDELAASEPILPEEEIAKAAKSSLGKATRVRARKQACDDIPELGDALAKGDTTGERADIVARALNGLSDAEKAKVAEHGEQIAAAATNAGERQFRETVERIVGKAKGDDGLDRLARQRRDTRLRWWTGQDGMWHLQGRFDPVRGVELQGRISNAIEALFHGSVPEDTPSDPIERQDHLAALALLALSEGKGNTGLPEVVVVIDEQTITTGRRHDGTILDANGVFGLPVETVRRWACVGTVNPVVVAADGTRLYLGRETRLANRAQRRALRVLYGTCALCDTAFDRCEVHHVDWYTHGGPTDIDNLLPLCSTHHHLAHEGGWVLILAPDRAVTVIRPGGHGSVHGPPLVRAA